jgi:hypothetical protein
MAPIVLRELFDNTWRVQSNPLIQSESHQTGRQFNTSDYALFESLAKVKIS